jgi:hypothetical protein
LVIPKQLNGREGFLLSLLFVDEMVNFQKFNQKEKMEFFI